MQVDRPTCTEHRDRQDNRVCTRIVVNLMTVIFFRDTRQDKQFVKNDAVLHGVYSFSSAQQSQR